MAHLGNLTVFTHINIQKIPSSAIGVFYPIYKQRLAGVTYINGVPAKMRIIVIDNVGYFLMTKYTNDDGTWEIDGLPYSIDGKQVTVISIDDTNTYNSEIFSNVFTVV